MKTVAVLKISISLRKLTSEWTTLHSKSPAVWLGFSHTAPSFLLFPTKLCCANFRGDPALRAKEGSRHQFHHANARRNGLRSIQKAQPVGWAFLIPLRHSSFSPQNFAMQTFAGAPPYGLRKGVGVNFITQTHVGMDYAPFKKPSRLAGLFSYRSVIPPFPHKTLLCKLSWGPRPTGQGGEQASISSRKLMLKATF